MADKPSQSNSKQRFRNGEYKKDRRQYSTSHLLKKRLPPREHRGSNDIYITNKSNFKGQQKECEDLLNSGINEIYLHGLGGAIRRTINLALMIEEKFGGMYKIDVRTSTVKIVDDFEPVNDEEDDYETQTRMNSAVKIKIFKQLQQL